MFRALGTECCPYYVCNAQHSIGRTRARQHFRTRSLWTLERRMQTVTWVKDLFFRKAADVPSQDQRPAPYLKTLSDIAGKHGRTKILPAPKFGFNRGK